jgi:glycosyltransferase involved in cell wall biosynthesis
MHAMGGVTTYMLTLRESDHCPIDWTATAIKLMRPFDAKTVSQLRQPIYTPRPLPDSARGHVIQLGSWAEAVQRVVNSCDMIVLWGHGIQAGLQQVDFQGKPVLLQAFGSCDWTKELIQQLLPYSTHYMAISHAAARTFPQPLWPKVRVIYCGINLARCHARKSRAEIRAEWGLRPSDRALGYVGRLSAEKNPLAVAQAVAELGAPYHAIYVGPDDTDPTIRERALRLVGRRVHFFPPVDHIGDVLAGLDAFILASPAEGFSLGLAEAWAAGVPTIATPVGAVELESEVGPLRIPLPTHPRPADLADAVRQLEKPSTALIVENARQLAVRRLQDFHFAENFSRYLYEILGRSYPASHARAG